MNSFEQFSVLLLKDRPKCIWRLDLAVRILLWKS